MSRVLARKLFKKKAPKRSAKGVGITSMLEDDVAGYAEGGEVDNNDRAKRERMAQELLDLGRAEYQMFAEGERPQMTRPPATMGMVPQPNPQAAQAAQMQQMAQMGMLPRFQEGGIVEAPTAWSQLRERLTMPFRERTGPILDPNTGEPVQFFNPDDLLDRAGYAAAALAASRLSGGIARLPRPGAGGGPSRPGPWEMDMTGGPWSAPIPLPRRATPPEPSPIGPTGPSVSGPQGAPQTSVPSAGTVSRSPSRAGGPSAEGSVSFPRQGTLRTDMATSPENYDYQRKEALRDTISDLTPPPSEERQAAMEADRESRRAAGFRKIEGPKAPPEEPKKKDVPPPPPPGGGKSSDMSDIKAEREAKAAMARQENAWLALMQAGLAIAGGRSPNAITNIGQGGQAGLASFMALEQQRRRDEDAAMRRDIAEREYRLQERRFQAQEPLLAAQAAYWQARPAMDAQRLAGQQAVARQRAAEKASELWNAKLKDPLFSVGKKPEALAIERDIFIKNETDRFQRAYLNEILYGSPGQSRAPAAPEE